MRGLLAAARRRASLVLLPLSIAPFAIVAPVIADSHHEFQRAHNMGPLAPVAAGLTAAERARFAPFAAPQGEVPVLVWQGVSDTPDGVSTGRRAFARQLALLNHLGYTAISTAQWAAFRAGRATLPPKPILLTIDGGRLDAYRGADRQLARAGMRAAMFVTTAAVEHGDDADLRWSELHRMVASGRWDVEPRGHAGAVKLTVAPDGTQAPFYAARRYTRSQGRETLPGWESRVSEDLFAARDRFAAQGLEPHAFAVPFSDYGQTAGNDPAIPGLLSGLLTRQFGSFFVQDRRDPSFTTPGRGAAERYLMAPGTSLAALYGWLREHAVPVAAPAPAQARPTARQLRYRALVRRIEARAAARRRAALRHHTTKR
jgi:hypothetical protein